MMKSSSNKKIALITGSNGQDGFYLNKLLCSKNYDVIRIEKKNTFFNDTKINHSSILEPEKIKILFNKYNISEVYHLAAKVLSTEKRINDELNKDSFNENLNVNVISFHTIIVNSHINTKIFYPTSSYIFEPINGKLNESAKLNPKNLYAINKAMSFWIAKNYRFNFNKFISTGIMFNHESKKRTNSYITKKIINQAKEIKKGQRNFFEVQNKNQLVDWGHAEDYVRAMYEILQLDKPDDFIISSGNLYSIADFIRIVCKKLDIKFSDRIIKSKLDVNDEYFYGDNSKLINATGWKPIKQIDDIVDEMI